MSLIVETPQLLTLNLLYYPRWQALIDGVPALVKPQSETGFLQVQMPAGEHHLALRYQNTPAEWAGRAISILTLSILILWGVCAWWRGKKRAASGADHDTQPQADVLPIWLLAGLALFLALKIIILDPHTTAFRCQSTEDKVCGAQTTVDVVFPDGGDLRGYAISNYEARPGDIILIEAIKRLKFLFFCTNYFIHL